MTVTARRIAIQVVAIALGVLLSTIVLNVAVGVGAGEAIDTLFSGAFGSSAALQQTALKWVPLALCGLAVALPLRMRLWNIGAEGQFHIGAIAASWVALRVHGLSQGEMLVVTIAAGMAGGALWALLAAIPRALWGVNEIITTLLLNYVAIQLLAFLVVGPLQGTQTAGFPISDRFPDASAFPLLSGQLHVGVLLPAVVAAGLYLALRFSRFGFEIKLIGASPDTARVVGMSAAKNIMLAMAGGGAFAGLAGAVEIVNSFGALQQGISPGYGYMAIVIAALADASLLGTLVVAFLFGGFIVGGLALQTDDVPASFVNLLEGIILFAAIAGARLSGVRMARRLPGRTRVGPAASDDAISAEGGTP